ncbi:hypothetical protein [Streptomyces sp. NPDC003395]
MDAGAARGRPVLHDATRPQGVTPWKQPRAPPPPRRASRDARRGGGWRTAAVTPARATSSPSSWTSPGSPQDVATLPGSVLDALLRRVHDSCAEGDPFVTGHKESQ